MVDARRDGGGEVAFGEQGVSLSDEGGEDAVAHLSALVEELFSQVFAFGFYGDVLHDAEQIARVDAVGKRV
jgi:hypothetical protein